jgi:molybdopterin synthase sulfur carrier subunit
MLLPLIRIFIYNDLPVLKLLLYRGYIVVLSNNLMSMGILLFGAAKDIAGAPVVEKPEHVSDVAALKVWLYEAYPALHQLKSLMIAVNRSYAADSQPVNSTDEIAVIPPVSGG